MDIGVRRKFSFLSHEDCLLKFIKEIAIVNCGVGSRIVKKTLAVELADADGVAPANDSIVDFCVHDVSDF